MIVCPNCKHGNPEGATNCEACYTALPATQACPTCGASIRVDATFCGQCGHNLKAVESKSPILLSGPATSPDELVSVGLPPTVLTIPAAELAELTENAIVEPVEPAPVEPDLTVLPIVEKVETPLVSTPVEPFPVTTLPLPERKVAATPVATQLQLAVHQLLHLQTNTSLEIPPQLQLVHLGKPNDQIPPDIDVSGFPSAEVVSRIHANIRVEGESYYLEDIGSANGTYINHNILPKGNRHLLRTGDRIGLGKGDLVTFIFQ
jgi:FHA domain/Double zinc ribbon